MILPIHESLLINEKTRLLLRQLATTRRLV
jgi:hypothetical protein